MLMYERYQALRTIYIRVPGEPGNEAIVVIDDLLTDRQVLYLINACTHHIYVGLLSFRQLLIQTEVADQLFITYNH